MEKMTEREETVDKEERKSGFLKSLGEKFTEVKEYASKERVLVYDLLLFTLGLLFSRCHIVFGAYPLGTALIATLSFGVPGTLIGAVVGALTLGRGGVIFAISLIITVFIRVIISGGDNGNGEERKLFSEKLILRMCAAVIGGFVCSVYELLLYGIKETSVLYGVSMILLPPALVFLFSGALLGGFSINCLAFGSENILSMSGKSDKDRANIVFFEISAVALMFFVALSLSDMVILGISLSYIFLFFATLLIAKRFGALRALTAGFIGSLGVSGVYSVSFGLLGLCSGGLFGFGIGYALLGGGISSMLWGFYSSGLIGLLSIVPEYSIAAILAFPILKKLSPEASIKENETEERCAKDMIGTMALLYQKKYSENLDALSEALDAISDVFKRGAVAEAGLDEDDLKMTVLSVASEFCRVCPGRDYCKSENINPCAKNSDKLAKKLISGEKIAPSDINLDDEFCQYPEEVCAALLREAAKRERESYLKKETPDSEGYELISRLISEARGQDEAERSANTYKSEQLSSVISDFGFGSGASKVFGDRRLHIFVAGEDRDGAKITSPEMKAAIEERLDIRLSDSEYFRKDSMVLLECSAGAMYTAEYSSAKSVGKDGERSGDTVSVFESKNGYFYALISDGMGRGALAGDTSDFVARFLEKMLDFSSSYDAIMHLLNRALKKRVRECSSTVDLFALDSFNGEVTFLKSGAAASYIKRDNSIFRIRSKTAPLGLLSGIDTEKIRVETHPGDYVIMISDGICQSAEESNWLLELLSKPPRENLKEYSEWILREAEKRNTDGDDMSVLVLRIKRIGRK